MKKIFALMLCLVMAVGFSACSDDDAPQANTQAVTAGFLNGSWMLAEIDGTPLGEGTYLYLSFDRKEGTFVMYHNLESMYSQRLTGSWSLGQDEDLGTLLTGEYDYDRGEWATYVATADGPDTLRLTDSDDPASVRIYTRCAAVPEDIVNGARSLR